MTRGFFAFISAHPRNPWLKNLRLKAFALDLVGLEDSTAPYICFENPFGFHSCANAVIVERLCHLGSAAESRCYGLAIVAHPSLRKLSEPGNVEKERFSAIVAQIFHSRATASSVGSPFHPRSAARSRRYVNAPSLRKSSGS